jgi:hypothetical protein
MLSFSSNIIKIPRVLKETEHRKREREKVLKKVRKSIERERERKRKGKKKKSSKSLFEGSEKAIRGGVNRSQTKFLDGTWPISQNRPDDPLF